jgi:molybdate transport system ATP-binding protein
VLEDCAAGVRVLPHERRVGVVFQDYLLFPHLSARENVAFGLRARGVPAAEARSGADAWLERVGLSAYGDLEPSKLSGGQSQRVALARALATEPDLLALDEPLAAMDVEARTAIRHDLNRHLREFRGPVLLVTHDPVEAATLADRLVIFENGRVTQEGTVAEVTRRPRSQWVARLAGVNLYRGTAYGTAATVNGATLALADRADGPVFVMIRPQAVALHKEAPHGSPRNVWRGLVREVDTFGERVRVWVDGPLSLVAEITPAATADLHVEPGATVWAAVKATEIEVYPA